MTTVAGTAPAQVSPAQGRPARAHARDARREAIIDVAGAIFLEEGFTAASMSAIAARLGGSKGTLYNYFDSKEALFAAYVQRHCAWQQEEMFALLEDESDIRRALAGIGRNVVRSTLSDFSLRNFRLIVAEAERSPELGRAFYEAGPLTGMARLAGMLRQAADRGDLVLDDPLAAAFQFMGLCQNRMLKARLCNVIPQPTEAEIDRDVSAAVDMFMAVFGRV
jgi:AcrR family transcriptional regulator